ncbi:Lipase-3 domain-containing protein [Mycena indigotica]|uniref:Lipase-3 domain-containing protein n=1 Tax=Mycena indigotica TaxID=2126181 RepID=A0A8H6T1X5_9AGAR|nr:Lipase-3 domain-containing protein [Mycena indigotica]KAF7309531.1 Lipase-3 domain-containing protein [Mycena indigotica]
MDGLLQTLVILFASVSLVAAAPAQQSSQPITSLSAASIAAFKPYSYYAAAGYCSPAKTLAWNCGGNCQANPTFKPVAAGGDGDATQFWFVGYDPTLATVIVSHQGTDRSQVLPWLTNANFFLKSLDRDFFPGVSSSVQTHSGFAHEHEKTAPQILRAVKTTISKFGAKKVTMVGHSLGGALALLDSVYLPLYISNVTFQTITYAMPRVGNANFADLASRGNTVTHINNKNDLIPILPGRTIGFRHPTGEIRIQDSGAWYRCPGSDNTNKLCTTGAVGSIFEGDQSQHDGPYDGVKMSSKCPSVLSS